MRWLTGFDRLGGRGPVGFLVHDSVRRSACGALSGWSPRPWWGLPWPGVQMAPVAETAIRSPRLSGRQGARTFTCSASSLTASSEMLWPGSSASNSPKIGSGCWRSRRCRVAALWSARLRGIAHARAGGGRLAGRRPLLARPDGRDGAGVPPPGDGPVRRPVSGRRVLSSFRRPVDTGGAGSFRPGDGQVRDAFGSPYCIWRGSCLGLRRIPLSGEIPQLRHARLLVARGAGLGPPGRRIGTRPASGRPLGTLSLAGLILTFAFRGADCGAWFESLGQGALDGRPARPVGLRVEIRRAYFMALSRRTARGLADRRREGEEICRPLAILLMAVDLVVANSRIVWSVPQSEFDREPLALKVSPRPRRNPEPGPYRLPSLPFWRPVEWVRERSPDRLREVVAWERDTLQAGYGSPYGVRYVMNPGTGRSRSTSTSFSTRPGHARRRIRPHA